MGTYVDEHGNTMPTAGRWVRGWRGAIVAVCLMAACSVLTWWAMGCSGSDSSLGPDPDVATSSTGGGPPTTSSSTESSSTETTSSGGGGPTQGLGYENGSRLRANVLVGEDGSKQFWGWHDSDRSEDCQFTTAADSHKRCMPLSSAATSTGTYFLDAQCSTELAVALCSPHYVLRYIPDGCSNRVQLYELGIQATPTSIYLKSGATCIETTPVASYTYWRIGSEVPSSAFARASVQTE
jgi:hypothetical protein